VISIIGSILGGLLGIGATAVDNWQKRQTVKAEMEAKVIIAEAEARVRLAERAQNAEIEWDLSSNQQMKGSWKDEWLTLLLSVPAIYAFIDPQAVLVGFQALEAMPIWYQTSLGVVVAASFGYRKLVDLFAQKGKK
jgi:hypothetical protein